MKKSPVAIAVSTAIGVTAAGFSNVTLAQELQEVVVTGTRIKTTDGFGQASPVAVVTSEDIKATGLTRLEDVLNSLPAVEVSQNSFISNGATGTASVDLRGLGASRTLVLFSGRRMQPGGVNTETPDVNQIPAGIIERIDVLTGGASATYGADAVSGVVNFVTRKVNGVELSFSASGYQHNNDNQYLRTLMDRRGFKYPDGNSGIDGQSRTLDLLVGSDFADGRGNATAYATWREGKELRWSARDYASCTLNVAGTACGGSGTSDIPNFYIYPIFGGEVDYSGTLGNPVNSDGYKLAPNGAMVTWDYAAGDNLYNFGPPNHFMRPDERYSLGAFVDYQVNDHLTPYLEINYTSSSSKAQIAESGTFFYAKVFDKNDALFPTAVKTSLAAFFPGAEGYQIYIGKRNTEGGPRAELTKYNSFRVVAGARGAITDKWSYDLSYQLGSTDSSSTYINDLIFDNIEKALSAGCASLSGGCYQVFTYKGITAAQAAALGGTAIATADTSVEIINGYVSGDLGFGLSGAGPIQAVFGAEYRANVYDRITDKLYNDGALAGSGSPFRSLKGGYNVSEMFVEFSVPVLDNLTADLAYRYSDYSTAGQTNTYRFGVDWKPLDQLRVRTGYNRAVRAPNIGDLYSPNIIGLWGGTDPCAGSTPRYTAAQCANTGVTAAQYGKVAASPASQYNQIGGGSLALQPETADTLTFGIVADPIENLTASIDYWNIDISDTISGLGPVLILEQCALQNKFCDLIKRGSTGSLWRSNNEYVLTTTQNFGEATWSGIDLAAAYRLEALGGTFAFNVLGTHMLKREVNPVPGNDSLKYDCVGKISEKCFAAPKNRATFGISYDSNEWWTVGGRVRYFSGVEYIGTADKIAKANMSKAQTYLDLNASFRFMDGWDASLGVSNVTDKEPPMVGDALSTNANTIAGFYDSLGRYLFAEVTARF